MWRKGFSAQIQQINFSASHEPFEQKIPTPHPKHQPHVACLYFSPKQQLDYTRREGETVTCNSNHFLWHLAIWSELALLFWLLFAFLLQTVDVGKLGSNIKTYEGFHYVGKDLS